MDKNMASKNIRMGLLLGLVLVIMGLLAWGWTVAYLHFVPGHA
jgi:hypothetical protein